MYGMTEQFNEAILGDTRKFHTRIKSGKVESVDAIKSVKHYLQIASNNYITIGGAYSSYVNLELWNPGFSLENNEFQLEIGLEFDSGEIEWCPIGKYTAESPKTSIDGMITATAYDRMQTKLSGAFFSELTYPTDAVNVLDEISKKTGVEIFTSNLSSGVVISPRKVSESSEVDGNGSAVKKVKYEKPFNGYTYKEAIGYIAMLFCKYAVVNQNGAVVFKWYEEVEDYKITPDSYYDDIETNETAFLVGKITCSTTEKDLSVGTGISNIQLENPVMTQERLDYIYDKVKKLEFIPAHLSFCGDIQLELGDVVRVEKSDGTIYSVPIMNMSHDFDGGLKTSIQSYGGIEQENSAKSPLINRLDRQYAELLVVKELVGEKANFDYVYALTGEYKTLKADYGGFKELVAESFNATNAEIENVKANNITTENLDAALANIGVLTAVSADLKYATIQSLEVLNGKFETLTSKAITADNLAANVATLGYATVDKLESDYAKIETLENEYLRTDDLSAKVANLGYAKISQVEITEAEIRDLKADYAEFKTGEFDVLKAKQAEFEIATAENFKSAKAEIDIISGDLADYKVIVADEFKTQNAVLDKLDTTYASIDFANIDIANINKANVAELFATMGLISTAVIENGHVTGYLDSVEVNANRITAGTLSVDRLIINGSEKSLIYALNNAGELVSTSVDTLDGDLITERTVTADKLVAHSITANEITTSNIIGASGWINLAQGTFNYGNQISWDGSQLYIAPESIFVAVGDGYASKDYVDSIKVGARNLIRNAKTLDFETYCFGGRTKFIADESGNRLTDENGAYLIA